MAEEEGFEHSVQVSSHGHLANDWFQPLTHSSKNPTEVNYITIIYRYKLYTYNLIIIKKLIFANNLILY